MQTPELLTPDRRTIEDPAIQTLLNSELIQKTEVIGIREGGIIDCWVPTELIDHEEVPVKEEWAKSLAFEMGEIAREKGGSGQLSPVILGMIEGEKQLKIMDGFHRDAALKINGESKVYSAVQLTDWDGLYDVRIFTAKDHAHVRFSRVVQWIREVWEHSGLSEVMTPESAILLYRFDTTGSKLHLDPDDVSAAKAWVAKKEQQWGMAAMTIHGHLKIAETVDPKLVHSAREKRKSDALEAPTQAILKIFSDNLPNNFHRQNLVMDAAMERNLTGPQVKAVCDRLKAVKDGDEQAVIAEINWDELKPSFGETKQRALRRAHDARYKGGSVFARAEWEIQSVSRRARLSAERDEEIDSSMELNILAALKRAQDLQRELLQAAAELGSLIGMTMVQSDHLHEATHLKSAPEVEIEQHNGIRADILCYLDGTGNIDEVKPFNNKQLLECFRLFEARPDQPEGWRNRFAVIQQAQLARRAA